MSKTASGSNVKAIDFVAMANAMAARVDTNAMISAYDDARRATDIGGFDAFYRAAQTNAPTVAELLVWTPRKPSDYVKKDGTTRTDTTDPLNDYMESLHAQAEPYSCAKTLLNLNRLSNLASHASDPKIVKKAKDAVKDVTGHSASRDKDADLKTAATALAALHRDRDRLAKSNSAPQWARDDVARAIDAVDNVGKLVGLARHLGTRRKAREAYFARLYLAHVGAEIVATCKRTGTTVSRVWNAAVIAARSAHVAYLKDTNKPTERGLLDAMRFAASAAIDATVEKVVTAETTVRVKDEELRGNKAKDRAIVIGQAVLKGLEKLQKVFSAHYKVTPSDNEAMMAAIRSGLGLDAAPNETEVNEELSQIERDKAQRAANAKAAKPAKTEGKAAKPAGTAPRMPRIKAAKPAPAPTVDAPMETSDSDSVLSAIGD